MHNKVLGIGCILTIFLNIFFSGAFAQSQQSYWQPTPYNRNDNVVENKLNLTHYKLFNLDVNALKETLINAPKKVLNDDSNNNTIVLFPNADGILEHFNVFETSNMEPGLAASFPEIKSYVGKGIDDPSANIYFSLSPLGLQTLLINADKPAVFIEPYTKDFSTYAVYRKGDKIKSLNQFECRIINSISETVDDGSLAFRPNADDGNLRTYRLALSVTGEYTTYFGGTKALALAAMNNSMTRVNGVFEIDFGIHMNLIANDTVIIYTNAATDPYSNASTGAAGAWNQELQTNLTNVIGNANYDIGHLFGASGGGGNAGCIGCVCVNPSGSNSLKKGSGFTSPADAIPQGDNFDIDYVAHEMGHQFGGNHTFTHSYEGSGVQDEPGSGSTIMGYAGITTLDVQPHSDAYFHAVSIQQITNYVKTTTCQTTTVTNNAIPTASAGSDYTIPKSTPFVLTGVGTDADNGDVLTYCWEEMDNGTSSAAPSATKSSGPDFRSYNPSSSPFRYFPKLSSIIAGSTTTAASELTVEALSSVARTFSFRFTVRDNHTGGPANNSDDMVVTVSSTTGPFVVTAPNTAVSWTGGTTQTVTWDVAGTTGSPVNCANVKISLSTDGGNTFPIIIAASTINDGTESITVPNNPTTQARIKVEAVGNIFFDMSNVNFSIIAPNPILTSIITQSLATNNICVGTAVAVDFNTNGPANAGNVFTAQLSNSSGSFVSGVVNMGTLSSINAGTINAVIPIGTTPATLYRVRVVSSNPVVNGSDNGTNISIYGIPAAAGNITGSSSVCQGQTAVLYSVPSIANATSYSWTIPSGITITSGANTNSITVSFSASATSPLILTVTGTNPGCSGTVSPNYNITVNPLPSGAGIISGTTSTCQNQTGVNYTVGFIAGATGYNWTLPTGASITAGANTNAITVSFSGSAVSGNITVAGTNACGSGSVSANFPVIVNTPPAPPVISAGGSTSICSPSTVDLSFTPTSGVDYQWRKDGINISSATSSIYSASVTGNYDVVANFTAVSPQTFTNASVFQIPDNNCTGASSTIAVSGYTSTINTSKIYTQLNITHPWDGDLVIFLQAPSGAIIGLANLVGSSGDNFTNTVFADSGSAQIPSTGAPYTGLYKPWATTFTSCTTSTITTFAEIGGGAINPNGNWTLRTYDRAVADSGTIQNWSITFPGVSSTCSSVSNAIGITVNSSVTAGLNITASPSGAICSGTNVTFTATQINGGTTPFYQWKKNGINVGTNSTTYSDNALNNNDVITCVLTSNATCVNGSPATSNSITMTVNANVTASVNIAASPSNIICSGTNVTFTATPTNGGTTPIYQWKKNGINVGLNSTTYSDNALNNNDVITCVLTSNATCVNGSPATSNSITMTVNANVTASVSIAASPSTTICSGTNVTFTATPTNGGTTPVYQWKKNGTNVGLNQTTYSNAALNNNDVITCLLTSNATCVNGSPATSNSITMTVNANVTASVSIAASPSTTICSGTNVTFTATPTNGGTTPVYQWKKNGTNVGLNSTTYSDNALNNNDVINCVLTSNATCVNGSPATSNAITMTVNVNVTASVSIAASPSNIICSGTNVTFTATPTNGGTTPVYQWKKNGSNVGLNQTTYSNAALNNNDVITCVMTSNATCVSGSPATSNAITMTVNAIVSASVSIGALPSTTICAGTNVTFTATPTNGGTTPIYQWKKNATNVGTNSTTYSDNALNNNDVITCVMTSNATCVNGSPATSNSISMTVNANVTASVSIAASPSNFICSGTNVTFTATPTNGGTTPVYQWKKNGIIVGTNQTTYSNAALNNNDVITCVLTSNATCVNGSPATSNTITMTVNANVTASVSIVASPSNIICSGTNVTFTATPTNGGTTPTYQWKKNGTNVGLNSTTYSDNALNNNDMITCVLTSNATCVNGSPATSNAITMTVNANVTASVSIAALPSTTICAGTTVTFTATPTNGGTTPVYQWKKNGSNVGLNQTTYSNAALNNNDVITCVMTSNATCVSGSPATSNAITMTVNAIPSISNFSPLSAIVGSSITISGMSFLGTTTVTFNGLAASFTVNNDNQISSIVPSNATTGLISITTPCGTVNSATTFTVLNYATLNVKVFVEGFYIGGGLMTPVLANAQQTSNTTVADSITMILHYNTTPFAVDTFITKVMACDGNAVFNLPQNRIGNSYYIAIRCRNGIETWSKFPVTIGSNTSFDFTQ